MRSRRTAVGQPRRVHAARILPCFFLTRSPHAHSESPDRRDGNPRLSSCSRSSPPFASTRPHRPPPEVPCPRWTSSLARVQSCSPGCRGPKGVWFALPFAHTGLSVSRTVHFLRPPTMRDYYTYAVVGVTQPNTYEAPGLMGAFMIVGGAGGVIVLMIGFVLLVERSWSRIARSFTTWPVALALTGSYLVGFIGEGTLLLGDLVKLALVIVTCESCLYPRARPIAGADNTPLPPTARPSRDLEECHTGRSRIGGTAIGRRRY